ncbi:MAG: pyridoxamine 5'-phosphate oxidase family protein [Dehalococcoidia bacterium]
MPHASRPYMPGYGLAPASEGQGLLPWSWAADRLARTRNYWLTSVRPGGAPHVMPVWGVWLDDRFYFSTSPTSRKARNLAAQPQCVLTADDPREAVIVEGLAGIVDDAATVERIIAAYNPKYGWALTAADGPFYLVRPRVVFGFIENSDAGAGSGDFAQTATRWTFDD